MLSVLFFISLFFFSLMRLNFFCQFFQQEEYDGKRFLNLFRNGKLMDKKVSIILFLLIFISFVVPPFIGYVLLAAVLIAFGVYHVKYNKKAKKPLVYTNRVRRILGVAVTLAGVLVFTINAIDILPIKIFVTIAYIQILPLILVIAKLILDPHEKITQKMFYNEAVAKLKTLNPTIIGITGSYGKTSVKHILAHVLSQAVPTLATPGSVNTVMGITRIIREKLQPNHKYFIAEMGAYGVGSIARLCEFCPPKHGILTAVGNAHYERFKSIDTVAAAKFELYQAVTKNGGFFVINQDQVNPSYIATHAVKKDNVSIIGSTDDVDTKILLSELTSEGLIIELQDNDGQYHLEVPLYGLQHVQNITLVFALAKKIGVPVSTIIAALKTMPQITHRLEVKKYSGGPDVIDDAYNSNPQGFTAALDVLNILGKTSGGRRILVTPGMVELGAIHDEKHFEVGGYAADKTDIVLLIGVERFPSFEQALRETNPQVEIHHFAKFTEARAWLEANAKVQDVILYENDLPDLYENEISL